MRTTTTHRRTSAATGPARTRGTATRGNVRATAARKQARVAAARLRSLLMGLLALVTAVAAAGCATPDDRPRIVVTTNILGDVTRQVVGTRPTSPS